MFEKKKIIRIQRTSFYFVIESLFFVLINMFTCYDLGSQLIVGAIDHQGLLAKIRTLRPPFPCLFKFNNRILKVYAKSIGALCNLL